MKNLLSEEQIGAYRDNGFLVIEGFFDDKELSEWRGVTDNAVSERMSEAAATLHNQWNKDDYYAQVFTQCIKLADTHEGMRALIHDQRLGEVVGTLAGVDGIRIWHVQALLKPAYGNPTGWHLDNPYWSFSSRDAISMWIALDDATASNGCLAYIPGSQKTARFDNADIGENFGSLFKVYPEWLQIDPLLCPCPAGSAVFHNGLTAHGAGANITNRARRAMTCAYMPDGSTFNGKQNVLPKEYYESLRIGDILDDEIINPLIWKK